MRDEVAPEELLPRIEHLGPYRLIDRLGEGGMGVVHLALDPSGRAVAIKVLRPSIAHDPEARARLGREVETLTRVQTPRVATVIDADIMGPRPYLVTRFVPGPSLDEVVQSQGPLGPHALLRVARGLVEAVRAIHGVGVIHRDVKPGNVLIEDDEPVLIDFGIAHIADDVRVTSTGLVMGTPGYLSPELVAGAAITEATDWWGWAATLTYAASGRPPFGRGPMDAVLARVREGRPDLEDVDARLAPLLEAALSPRPHERPEADEVIEGLSRYAMGLTEPVPSPVSRGRMPSATMPLPQGAGSANDVGAAPPPAPVWRRRPWPSADLPAPPPRRDPYPPAPSAAEQGYASSGSGPDVEHGPGQGDPRVGRAPRSGTLAASAAALLAATAVRPMWALVALAVWCFAARAVDASMTSLVLRRHERGRRRSDVGVAIASAPWHALRALVTGILALILPLSVLAAGSFAVALLVSVATSGTPMPDTGGPLAVGMAGALVMLWYGPGGVSLRRGSRSIVRALAPEGPPQQVFVTLALLVAAGLAIWAVTARGAVSWTPMPRSPLSWLGWNP